MIALAKIKLNTIDTLLSSALNHSKVTKILLILLLKKIFIKI